ncbi:hypothetical protein GCM10029964_026990 [Kibdelosporangium lantanae]
MIISKYPGMIIRDQRGITAKMRALLPTGGESMCGMRNSHIGPTGGHTDLVPHGRRTLVLNPTGG